MTHTTHLNTSTTQYAKRKAQEYISNGLSPLEEKILLLSNLHEAHEFEDAEKLIEDLLEEKEREREVERENDREREKRKEREEELFIVLSYKHGENLRSLGRNEEAILKFGM